ncbi:MAG: PhnD/SsuA/transferrin family substrate-binding protein [Cytophagales bacterium]|nr:PhnD/SsuA/transferrin family substrate-binding protein [Cytophagales bacterium]
MIVLLSVCILSCQKAKQPIRIATYTYATNNRINNLTHFAKALEAEMKRPVEVQSYPDVASFIEGIKSDQVDVGFINTLGYLLLARDNEYMDPIATLKVKEDAVDNYKTVLLTNNERVTDLEAISANANTLSMMFVAPGSTSGNLVPRLMLSAIGIKQPEATFSKVAYGGNHTSTFDLLKEGVTDLCAIGSNEYYKQIAADSSLGASTQLLWISEEIPLGPVLLNKRFSSSDRTRMTALILKLHEADPQALASIKDGWSEAKQAEKFHAITDKYYDNFRMVNGNRTDLSNILKQFVQ